MANWFTVVATLFYLFSFIVSALIASFAYKSYKLTKEKKFRNFSIAFLFITLSFVVQAITNIIVYLNLQNQELILPIISNGFAAYALLTIAGFFILAVLSFKITNIKITSIVAALIVLSLFFSPNFIIAFHIIMLALLAFINYSYYRNCSKKKSIAPKVVFGAFLFLFLANVLYLTGRSSEIIFIIGNVVQFMGYLALLIAILRFK